MHYALVLMSDVLTPFHFGSARRDLRPVDIPAMLHAKHDHLLIGVSHFVADVICTYSNTILVLIPRQLDAAGWVQHML